MRSYELCIGALIGLAKTIDNNERVDESKSLIYRTLRSDSDDSARMNYLDVVKLKNTFSPNCLTCAAPCGRTDDYDVRLIKFEAEEIKSEKNLLIDQLKELSLKDHEEKNIDIILRSLYMIGGNYPENMIRNQNNILKDIIESL